jgi:cytochrome c556
VIDAPSKPVGVLSRSDILVHERQQVEHMPEFYHRDERTVGDTEPLPSGFLVELVLTFSTLFWRNFPMRRATLVLSCLVLLGLSGSAAAPATPAQQPKVFKIMTAKLKASQTLLAGIATEDFKKITLSAEELIQLTRREEWHVIKTPKFEMFSNEFRRTAEVIIQKAKAKSLDGVTLTYFEMTMSCVRCHQYIREVRDARLPAKRPRDTVIFSTP